MVLLPQLKQRAVRDLYWACFSESIMASGLEAINFEKSAKHFPHLEQWFLDLDAEPHLLLAHLSSQKSTRLGLYFEALWEYYLRYADVAQLLAKNRQVSKDKQTIGEYDFIYYCFRRQSYIHLETAVKFYIGDIRVGDNAVTGLAQTNLWIGPACRDRLDIKYDSLMHRQLKLSQTEEGEGSLQQLGVNEVACELALKGILFYPDNLPQAPGPIGNDSAHQRGTWLKQCQLSTFFAESIQNDGVRWIVLERQQWCSPMQGVSIEQLFSSDQLLLWLKSYFSDPQSVPIQISSMEQSTLWRESQRYFIVSDTWSCRVNG